jgi:cell wall-associated NlpC family hydrolase
MEASRTRCRRAPGLRDTATTTAAALILVLPTGAMWIGPTVHPRYSAQALATGMPPINGPYLADPAGTAPVGTVPGSPVPVGDLAGSAPAPPTAAPPPPDLAGSAPAPLTAAPPPPDLTGTGLTDPGPSTAPPVSPVVARIQREAAEVEALGERVTEERDTQAVLLGDALAGEALWAMASERYRASRSRSDEWARRSYLLMARTGSPRPGPRTDVARGQHGDDDAVLSTDGGLADVALTGTALGLASATQRYAEAHLAAAASGAEVRRLGAELTRRTAALDALRTAHRAELEAARIRAEAHDSALSRQYLSGAALTGGTPAPAALTAVRFALAQLGKPYVWGAEGPSTYDCSGLVQTAYATAGITLPRTARPQYLATTPVPVNAMIAGDLLFFGPDRSNWNSIHHVGIYLGGGRMVHAPTTGDVVRIAPVWWAEFFGATRVAGAVPSGGAGAVVTARPPLPLGGEPSAPAPSRPAAPRPTTPRPSPTPTPAPTPTTSPSPSPSPGPIGPTVPVPTESPSPTPTPTPTCPTPDPSPTVSPSTSPTDPPDPGCSPSPTPTPSDSPATTP